MFEDISKILLLTDMDGTLLSKDKSVSPENLAALSRFRKAGGRFSIATGRVIQATQQYAETLSLDGPSVLCNGCMIYDFGDKTVKWQETLPEDKAKVMIMELLNRFPQVSAEINTPFTAYVVQCNDISRQHRVIAGMTAVEEVNSIEDVPRGSWNKVLFAMESRFVSEFAQYAKSLQYYDCAEFVTSDAVYHEMLPPHCSKGDAMRKIVSLYKLDGYTVVAMGDYNNDLRMLELADFAACPSTAIPEVKAAADMVCKADSSTAVAEVLSYIMDRKD